MHVLHYSHIQKNGRKKHSLYLTHVSLRFLNLKEETKITGVLQNGRADVFMMWISSETPGTKHLEELRSNEILLVLF